MKKIMIFVVLAWILQFPMAYAEAPESSKAANLSQPALMDSQFAALKSRIETLEREVAKLEQYNRYQDDKIRNLDRAVDDIQRRRLR